MLAGAEGGRGIERDPDRRSGRAATMMRAVDEKAADPQRRKSELVLGQPIAIGQVLLVDLDEFSSARGGGKGEPRRQLWGQH